MKHLLLAFSAAIFSFSLLAAGLFFLPSIAPANDAPAMSGQQAQAFKKVS